MHNFGHLRYVFDADDHQESTTVEQTYMHIKGTNTVMVIGSIDEVSSNESSTYTRLVSNFRMLIYTFIYVI